MGFMPKLMDLRGKNAFIRAPRMCEPGTYLPISGFVWTKISGNYNPKNFKYRIFVPGLKSNGLGLFCCYLQNMRLSQH